MKNLILPFRLIALLSIIVLATSPTFGQTGLIISQLYGGGGNASATYTNDFIELYNSSAAAINLGGLSVQYASAAGTSWNAAILPSYSLAAGHYYLIEAAAGSTAALALPTPDLILTLGPPSNVTSSFVINLSATAGKVALVNGIAPLTTACPTGASIIDFVGYGTTANCFEGATAPAPANNATSLIRTNSTDTNNNAADFSTVSPPNPRNTAFGVTGGLSASGLANPAVVTSGNTTLLTVTVTPATSPAPSTGIAVKADLSAIGGTATQQFYDNGTNGDVTANDNIFSFSTVATTAASGPISISATVTDLESNTANASIPLTVNLPVPTVSIHDIQGVKSTTAATVSPYVSQVVQTSGVVTAVLSNAFFIQARDSDKDSNPLTPEGVEVFTSSHPSVAVGNYVQVIGTVSTYPAVTASHTPATEITAPTVTLLQASIPLPAPIPLDATMLTASGGLYQLTPYEGMRVSIASMTAVSGTNGSITDANEPSETATSTGYFYAVIGNTARPFREPGIDIRDTPIPGAPANIAKFDDNPERILVDSTIAGGTSLEISTGAVLSNVAGVLDFTFSSDSFYDPSRLILDATYDRTQVTPGMTPQPVPATAANHFTVASFNIERFYNSNAADDLYYVPAGVNGYNGSSSTPTVSTGETFISEAVDVTPAAYQRRLQKLSLAICNVLNAPDIVTLEEVENQSVADDIATQINTTCGVSYTAYSTDNSHIYSQDGTGISVGFLIKNSTVDALGLSQVGALQSFTPTGASTPITLNDRPWLALNAGIKRANAKDYPVTIIVNHMKALTGVNSTTSTSTRQKKELQAEDIAAYIQSLQAQGQHVISGGDFNAFEFSDGYTDTLGTYTNTNVLPADQVVQPGTAGLVTPPLTDLALTLPQNQRWSYDEDGNAQVLDHIVVTQDLVAGASLVYAHLNADFPVTAYNDATTPARTSDHDVPVGYFAIPAPTLTAVLSPASADFGSVLVGVHSTGKVFTLANIGDAAITISSITATGDFAQTNNCGATLAVNTSCTANVVFTPTATGARTGSFSILTNVSATAYTAPLTGVGAPPADFTLADTTGKSTTTVTVAAGSTATATLVFTPVGGFNASIATTCVAQGTAPAGVTCTAPAAFTLSGTAAVNQTVSFATTSRTKTSGIALSSIARSPWSAALILMLTALLMLLVGRTRRLARISGLLALLLAIFLPAIGCSHGSNTNSSGTPAGSYAYTVTATSGSTNHTETVTLVVQ